MSDTAYPMGTGHSVDAPVTTPVMAPPPVVDPTKQVLLDSIMQAKIGMCSLDACEMQLRLTNALISPNAGLRRERLLEAKNSLMRLVTRMDELLK
jgi:hypothetical protein